MATAIVVLAPVAVHAEPRQRPINEVTVLGGRTTFHRPPLATRAELRSMLEKEQVQKDQFGDPANNYQFWAGFRWSPSDKRR